MHDVQRHRGAGRHPGLLGARFCTPCGPGGRGSASAPSGSRQCASHTAGRRYRSDCTHDQGCGFGSHACCACDWSSFAWGDGGGLRDYHPCCAKGSSRVSCCETTTALNAAHTVSGLDPWGPTVMTCWMPQRPSTGTHRRRPGPLQRASVAHSAHGPAECDQLQTRDCSGAVLFRLVHSIHAELGAGGPSVHFAKRLRRQSAMRRRCNAIFSGQIGALLVGAAE